MGLTSHGLLQDFKVLEILLWEAHEGQVEMVGSEELVATPELLHQVTVRVVQSLQVVH